MSISKVFFAGFVIGTPFGAVIGFALAMWFVRRRESLRVHKESLDALRAMTALAESMLKRRKGGGEDGVS